METFWFVVVAFMLTVYVILDGFDLGAGIVHWLVAKTEDERALVHRAIGPVWDGNEVWLLAAGGTLFFSFPTLYAASFSGFYLPLMMVLWLLMLRGIGIELRHHIDHPMWRSFWDIVFSFASILLAIFFGAALGNVIRGVPLNADKTFFEPLWTNFQPHGQTGILDWYTVLAGVVALVALAVHGANYLAVKTDGVVQMRARHIARMGSGLMTLLVAVSFVATVKLRPQLLANYRAHLLSWLIPLAVLGALAALLYFRQQANDLVAFVASSICLAGLLGGAAFGMFPVVLPATTGSQFDLTIWNTAAQSYGLRVGLVWWLIGMTMATVYFTYLYRSFRGKVSLAEASH
jgi:cytochrome bd ubiquinol oxidase subunit II